MAQLLEGSRLGGRPVTAVRVPGGEDEAFVVGCAHDEVRDAWEAARPVRDRSGRWPGVAAGW